MQDLPRPTAMPMLVPKPLKCDPVTDMPTPREASASKNEGDILKIIKYTGIVCYIRTFTLHVCVKLFLATSCDIAGCCKM